MTNEIPPFPELDHEAPPPPELKGRVTRALRESGLLIAPSKRRRLQVLGVAAGLLIMFAAGYGIGASRWKPEEVSTPRFMLLLYEDSTFHLDRPMMDVVAEYGAWADSLRVRGKLEGGEKLGDEAQEIGPATPLNEPVSRSGSVVGFFVVRAATLAEARLIAGSCPHIRYGGRIVVRPIAQT